MFSAVPDDGRCGEPRPRGFAVLLGPQRDEALPAPTYGKDYPVFVRALRSLAAG
jgi:hypothetical protein